MEKVDLYDLSLKELEEFIKKLGEKPFRAKQIYKHLWERGVDSFEGMTDLSKNFRELLAEAASLGSLELIEKRIGDQGLTRKALWKTKTGEVVESVLMVYPNRATVCVSSQAGCPMACVFCATGKMGLLKQLTAGEIAQQVIWAQREVDYINKDELKKNYHKVTKKNLPQKLSNVVFMGMGEPFNNYKNWWKSVETLHDPLGFNMGARNFTVSTVGLVPGIRKLAKESLPINLAVSLHTPFNESRDALMPVNKKYPIEKLIETTRDYFKETGRRVSFEYCLIRNKNDSEVDAMALAQLLTDPEKFPCHVNLIPWNPIKDSGLKTVSKKSRDAFKEILEEAGIPCTIRIERGQEIDAACGQLAGAELESAATAN